MKKYQMEVREEYAIAFGSILAAGLQPDFILGRLRDECRYEIQRHQTLDNKEKYEFWHSAEKTLDTALQKLSQSIPNNN